MALPGMKPDTRLRVPRGRGRGRGRGPGARAEARGRAGAGAREARLDRPGGPGSLESARGQGQAPRATLLPFLAVSSRLIFGLVQNSRAASDVGRELRGKNQPTKIDKGFACEIDQG